MSEQKKPKKKKTTFKDLKPYLKAKAKEIQELKLKIKNTMREKEYAGSSQMKHLSAKFDYRHHHIAYCELRGRTRDQIEKPAEDNLPIESVINDIKVKYAFEEREECDGQENITRRAG